MNWVYWTRYAWIKRLLSLRRKQIFQLLQTRMALECFLVHHPLGCGQNADHSQDAFTKPDQAEEAFVLQPCTRKILMKHRYIVICTDDNKRHSAADEWALPEEHDTTGGKRGADDKTQRTNRAIWTAWTGWSVSMQYFALCLLMTIQCGVLWWQCSSVMYESCPVNKLQNGFSDFVT